MNISIQEFVEILAGELLQNKSFDNEKQLLHYGHVTGWLEDQDEVFPQALLDKRTAARIVHSFMIKELHIPDEVDISKAQQLGDLYTCRVCVNHIAQVFVKNLMESEEVEFNGKNAVIFNMMRLLTKKEALELIKKVAALV